jgi:hypothetical protein
MSDLQYVLGVEPFPIPYYVIFAEIIIGRAELHTMQLIFFRNLGKVFFIRKNNARKILFLFGKKISYMLKFLCH